MSTKTKDLSIETLRGIAIILVVAGYIISGDLENTHSLFSSALRFGYYLLKPIRLPLFTVISAYLYASSPATQATFKKLATGKTRRILIPFAVVSAMQYLFFSVFQYHGPHPINEIFKIYVWPFEQFWFLWAVFCIFMVVGFLDAHKALDTKQKWMGWMALSIACHILLEPTRMFAIHGINYLFPFFLMGYGIKRFSKELFTASMIRSYIAVTVFTYCFYAFFYNKLLYDNSLYKVLALLISLTSVPLIFHFRRALPWLPKIGYYSFGIHIFNKISSALPAMLFARWHIDNVPLIFFSYLGCGIVFSIGAQMMLECFSVTRRYVLGMKEGAKDHPAYEGNIIIETVRT